MEKHKTLVLGASLNPQRYSHLAILSLTNEGITAKGVGLKEGKVANTMIEVGFPKYKDIHTVSIYLNAGNQKMYYDYILSLAPKRIIFNPGAENSELQVLAEAKGIETTNACTLVLLSTKQYTHSMNS